MMLVRHEALHYVRYPEEIAQAVHDFGKQAILYGGDGCDAFLHRDTLLHHACKEKCEDAINACIAQGADVNAAGFDGGRPLHRLLGAQSLYKTHLIELLVKAGADINACDRNEMTLLHLCAIRGGTEELREAIRLGADVNPQDANNETPLMGASRQNRAEVVETLVAAGADVTLRDDNGATALHVVGEKVTFLVRASATNDTLERTIDGALERAGAIVEALVRGGADVNAQDADGKTPLMVMCYEGWKSAARALLNAGADPLLTDAQGATASDYIARSHNLERRYDILGDLEMHMQRAVLTEAADSTVAAEQQSRRRKM